MFLCKNPKYSLYTGYTVQFFKKSVAKMCVTNIQKLPVFYQTDCLFLRNSNFFQIPLDKQSATEYNYGIKRQRRQ